MIQPSLSQLDQNSRQLLTPDEVAQYLRIPKGTLANWRYQSIGPPYVRLGRHVRYHLDALERWVAQQART
jgi:excisionase family DNA binding protein